MDDFVRFLVGALPDENFVMEHLTPSLIEEVQTKEVFYTNLKW